VHGEFLTWESTPLHRLSSILAATPSYSAGRPNPGAAALQDAVVDGEPLYARVMRLFQPAIAAGMAGLVIGARERQAFGWAARLAPVAGSPRARHRRSGWDRR